MARYQGVQFLGAGAFGRVHLALDTHTQTSVAVKLLTNSAGLERFEREAEMLVDEVGNPHVVQILDHNLHVPVPFLVLEYCDQGSLARWITKRPPWQEVALALSHVASGLAPLHARGGFHRDIKPGNLLVKLDPARGYMVKVADFGLARRPITGPGAMTNTAAGTTGYIAPEVIRTSPFDSRADIYSLGVVALELLTGGRDLRALPAFGPAGLQMLVREMLDSDPSRRPNAEQLVTTLVDLVERDRPAEAPAEPAGPTFMEALFGGLAVGAAILGAAALVMSAPGDRQ